MKVVGDRTILMPDTNGIHTARIELAAGRDAAGKRAGTVHLLNVAVFGRLDDPTRSRGHDGGTARIKRVQVVGIDALMRKSAEVARRRREA